METFEIFKTYLEYLHDLYAQRATSKQYKGTVISIGTLRGHAVVGVKFSSKDVKFEASDRVMMNEKSAIVEYYKRGLYFFRVSNLSDIFEGGEVQVVSSADLLFLVENMIKVLKMVYTNENYKEYRELIDNLYSSRVSEKWLGPREEAKVSESLTDSQNSVVTSVFKLLEREQGIIPVEGPGGTGKTECIAEIARHCVKKGKRILICSPTNLAVDNVLGKLADEELVLRIGSETSISKPEVRKFSARSRIREDQNFDDLVKESKIIGSTLDSVGIHLKKEKFDLVVIDESSAVELPKLLLAFVRSKRIVIFGDTRQLSQFIEYKVLSSLSETLSEFDLQKLNISPFSLISKQWGNQDKRLRLLDNFRNPRRIFEFINKNYYQDKMVCRKEGNFEKVKPTRFAEITKSDELAWIVPHNSALEEENRGIFNTVKLSQRFRTSYFNYGNLVLIMLMLKELLKTHSPKEIGIISPFTAQVALIREFLIRYPDYVLGKECKDEMERTKLGFFLISNLNVNTINKFQGQEREVIIFDITSNADFIFNDEKKLNVVLGRAKKQAILVGLPPQHPKFHSLFESATTFGDIDQSDYSLMFVAKDEDVKEFNKVRDLLELIKDSDFSPKDPELYLKKELLNSIMSSPTLKKDVTALNLGRKVSDIVSDTLREFFSSELINEDVYNNLEYEIEQKVKGLVKRSKLGPLFGY